MLTKEINLCTALPGRTVARQPWVKGWHLTPSLSGQELLSILDCENERQAAFTKSIHLLFTSQLLHFNYLKHLVHSCVSSLFNLKDILSHALWTCLNVLSYSCVFTSISSKSHMAFPP